ncbi:hypothetical protein [Dictyobacter arantiisoli]|uniref:Uncharacterized protein n=1 Tax=Dictyobacter arantiisoli TaxID=2014874 RepID=A0A5A5TA81_9CHLR|nr:hypothetical protein [Dictyobacter arantiisoli]GCF08257.1 hypothetical protein KDI_18210 [Dictyobacter arantiisoli]
MISGAHGVGVLDGGPDLPFLGWSTQGGDLRIAHFVELHALQVLPFIGWFLSAKHFPHLRTAHRVALVWTLCLGHRGLVVSLLGQALRGQSSIAPDMLTWLTWGGVVSATVIVAAAVVLHVRLNTAHSTRLVA